MKARLFELCCGGEKNTEDYTYHLFPHKILLAALFFLV